MQCENWPVCAPAAARRSNDAAIVARGAVLTDCDCNDEMKVNLAQYPARQDFIHPWPMVDTWTSYMKIIVGHGRSGGIHVPQ